MNNIKIKNTYASKNTINKVGNPKNGKNFASLIISSKFIPNKRFVARINSLKCNPIKEWTKSLNKHFSREEIQITNNHMKKYSASLSIRVMLIKTQCDTNLHLLECLESKSDKKYQQ